MNKCIKIVTVNIINFSNKILGACFLSSPLNNENNFLNNFFRTRMDVDGDEDIMRKLTADTEKFSNFSWRKMRHSLNTSFTVLLTLTGLLVTVRIFFK